MLDEKKKELCNIRRLEALKAKKQEKNVQTEHIKASLRNLDSKDGGSLNKKIVFQSDDSDDDSVSPVNENKKRENAVDSTKLFLFPSDSEEDEEDNIDHLKIRPEFKVSNRSQFLEETGDERFKLSSIFMEEEEEDSGVKDQAIEMSDDEKDEKKKNMEILESVLGFQLPNTNPVPETIEAKQKKRYVRFNPEDENSEKYLRKTKPKDEDKPVEKEVKAASTVSEPQVSPTRYFEVSTDLKSAFQETAEDFQLSKMFGFGNEERERNDEEFSFAYDLQNHRPTLNGQSSIKSKATSPVKNVKSLSQSSSEEIHSNEQHPKFFVLPGDPRLTEGVKFFRREKLLEEIHANFYKTRKLVLELLKRRHRRGLRAPYVIKNKRK